MLYLDGYKYFQLFVLEVVLVSLFCRSQIKLVYCLLCFRCQNSISNIFFKQGNNFKKQSVLKRIFAIHDEIAMTNPNILWSILFGDYKQKYAPLPLYNSTFSVFVIITYKQTTYLTKQFRVKIIIINLLWLYSNKRKSSSNSIINSIKRSVCGIHRCNQKNI